MKIYNLETIKKHVHPVVLQIALKKSFQDLDKDQYHIAPVVHMGFENPQGDCHIKSGYLKKSPYYVIKIASGFNNQQASISNSQGCYLIGCTQTGRMLSLLADNGYLTDLRTALTVKLICDHLPQDNIQNILFLGTSGQTKLQIKCLKAWLKDKAFSIYGRNPVKAMDVVHECHRQGLTQAHVCTALRESSKADLIITNTSSKAPLIEAPWVHPNAQIIAVGADCPGKQELDEHLFEQAHIVVDHVEQCISQGESQHAYRQGKISQRDLTPLGAWLSAGPQSQQPVLGRTIFDLTGVASQDICIAQAIFNEMQKDR